MKPFACTVSTILAASILFSAQAQDADPRGKLVWEQIGVVAHPPLPPSGIDYQVSMQGHLHLHDISDTAAVNQQAFITRVEGPDGSVLYSGNMPTQLPSFNDQFRYAYGREEVLPPMRASARFSLKDPLPPVLSRVVGRLYVLKRPVVRQVKVPLQSDGKWFALDDKTSAYIEQVAKQDHQLRISAIVSAQDTLPRISLGNYRPPLQPGAMVHQLVLVDQNGHESPRLYPKTAHKWVDQRMTHVIDITVAIPDNTTFQALRFDVVDHEVDWIEFELRDLKVPNPLTD